MADRRHAEADVSASSEEMRVGRGLRGLGRAAVFHYGRLLGNGLALAHQVQDALAATPEESVLDVGCGTGGLSRCAPGAYLGIDVDPDYVGFARLRFGSPRRRFEAARLEEIPLERAFDKAMLVNCLHHLSDEYANWLLQRLARIVRGRVLIADPNPEIANPLQAFLIACDRGDYIRPIALQRALIERHFRITAQRGFPNSIHTVHQVLFVCEPQS